jgi:hypothetical protein
MVHRALAKVCCLPSHNFGFPAHSQVTDDAHCNSHEANMGLAVQRK